MDEFMGGLFGVASKEDCVSDLFYGTDYHFHLGSKRAGLVVKNSEGFQRSIHNIEDDYFRTKFSSDIKKMHGTQGIGVISDYEDQPLLIGSHLGTYGIITVGKVANLDELVSKAYRDKKHFSEMGDGKINPTELIGMLINEQANFKDGIRYAQETIKGSCSLLILTDDGIYAARDKLGRTPIIIAEKKGSYAATFETSALPTRGYEPIRDLGSGEIVLLTPDGIEQIRPPDELMQLCGFLYVYYSFPPSFIENIMVSSVRARLGYYLAQRDIGIKVDRVSGIPDSGTKCGLGYANTLGIPYESVFEKYTPTYGRSFLPSDPEIRAFIADHKLIPVIEYIKNAVIVITEDSIVRGTQGKKPFKVLWDYGAKEVHARISCPPLLYACPYHQFTRARSNSELAARRAIKEIEGRDDVVPEEYLIFGSEKYQLMVDKIRLSFGMSSLVYQTIDDTIKAIGLPKEKLCTHCWDGCSYF